MALTASFSLLGAIACHSENGRGPSRAQREVPPSFVRDAAVAEATPAAVAEASFTIAKELAARDAAPARPGHELVVELERSGVDKDGRLLATLGVTPDGELVTAANPRPGSDGESVTIGQSEVRLDAARGARRLSLAASAGPAHQAAYADSDARTVVWIETPSVELGFFEWRVYAYDRDTRRTTLLGDSTALHRHGRLAVAPGGSAPTIGGGRAAWATSYAMPSGDDWGVRIVARDLQANGPLVTLAEGAKLPAAVGADVYYVRTSDAAPAFPADRYEIRRVGADGTDDLVASAPLAPGEEVTALVAKRGYLAWVVASAPSEQPSSRLHVLDPRARTALVVRLDEAGQAILLSGSERLLAWSNGSGSGDAGQYELDVAAARLWRLGEAPGYGLVYAAGDRVAWSRLGDEPQKPEQNAFVVARWRGLAAARPSR
jgi:hypothetical protein